MNKNNSKIKIRSFEQIETDELIWDIENSRDFYIYEIKDGDDDAEILVKILNSESTFDH